MSTVDEIIKEALLSELKEINLRIAPILQQVEPELKLKADIESRLKEMGYSPETAHLIKKAEKPLILSQSPLKVKQYDASVPLIDRGFFILDLNPDKYLTIPEIITEIKEYEPALKHNPIEARRYQSVLTTAFKKKFDLGILVRIESERGIVYQKNRER